MDNRKSNTDDIEWPKVENKLEDLMKSYEERKQLLMSLRQQREELNKNYEDIKQSFKLKKLVEKAEEMMKEVQEQEAVIQRRRQEYAELVQRKKEMELEIQKSKPYYDFMDRACKLTKFKNMDEMADYFTNLFQVRDHLIEKEKQKKEHMEQQKKELQELKDPHELTCLQKTNELAQLQTEMDEARSVTHIWEQKWKHIQKTASKKTLKLGQIKMATLTLYESIGGCVGAEGVAIEDTETQLDGIKTFILDNNDIVEHYKQIQKKENNKTDKENKDVNR